MAKRESSMVSSRLTPTELEFMNILWEIGEGSVNDVLARLSPQRERAYTSVATILRLLEQKKILKTKKMGRGHVFVPLLSKETYERNALGEMIQNVFNGAPSALIMRLVASEKISKSEADAIRALLDRKK